MVFKILCSKMFLSWSYLKKKLGWVLPMRPCRFGAYSVHATAASVHTQCMRQRLWRILSKRQSVENFLSESCGVF